MAYTLITSQTSSNSSPREAYGGVTGKPKSITHHWWNTPEAAGSLETTVDFFVNKSPQLPAAQRTSAHYVVSDTTVYCIVSPDLAAWHTGSTRGNAESIGIEIDPRLPGQTLETVAQLCADLEKHYDPLLHYGHKEWSATQCPGVIFDKIPWIIDRTNQLLAGASGAVTEAPAVKAAQTGAAAVQAVHMVYPLPEGTRISQDFGQHGTKFNLATGGHTGRDYAVPTGTEVVSMANGRVLWADWASNLPGDDSAAGWESRWLVHKQYSGITVVIDHGTFLSLYAHLNRTDLNTGDTVRAGQKIGESGSTGTATTGPHLHWEVITKPYQWWTNGYYGRVNPAKFVENNRTRFGAESEHWSDMASKEEIKQAVREVLGEELNKAGGEKGKTSMRAEAEWAAANFRLVNDKLDNLTRMVSIFHQTFRIGIPGVISDGALGYQLRQIFKYDEAKQGKARAERYRDAEKVGFPSWK